MASQKQQWINLEEVINLYIDISEQSIHKYFKLWNIAFTGLEQLGLDFFYQIKSVQLPINANKTVTLPADYLQYSKVGWLNGRGEVATLKYNERLTTLADLLPSRLTKIQSNNQFNPLDPFILSSPYYYNFWNGYDYVPLYGLPADGYYGGTFKIADGVILLDSYFCWNSIVLEYVASPKEGETYYIPVQFKEAMIAYLGWKDIQFLPNTRKGSIGDKQIRKRDFYNERRLANARYNPFDIMQAYKQNLEAQRLTVKV